MNRATLAALERIIDEAEERHSMLGDPLMDNVYIVRNWLDEVVSIRSLRN